MHIFALLSWVCTPALQPTILWTVPFTYLWYYCFFLFVSFKSSFSQLAIWPDDICQGAEGMGSQEKEHGAKITPVQILPSLRGCNPIAAKQGDQCRAGVNNRSLQQSKDPNINTKWKFTAEVNLRPPSARQEHQGTELVRGNGCPGLRWTGVSGSIVLVFQVRLAQSTEAEWCPQSPDTITKSVNQCYRVNYDICKIFRGKISLT